MANAQAFSRHFVSARPRAMAALTRYFRTVDLAEDAFQDACVRAVKSWPDRGVPKDPTAWLILVGRNAGVDALRRRETERAAVNDPAVEPDLGDIEADYADAIDTSDYRDDVLRLLFMCCHDELSVQDQLALALKIVVGFSVEEIARAFLVKPKSMEQRITRAKKKAASVVAMLETPSPQERAERLNAVLVMLYLLFNEGYSSHGGSDHIRKALCQEAIRLNRLLLSLFPAQPEVMGLLALCLLHDARSAARQDVKDTLIPLDEQNRRLWDRSGIEEGQVLVEKALRRGQPGAFQIQAAIAAVHCAARSADETDWAEIERLYRALENVQPSPVVTLNRLVAVSKTKGAQIALNGMSEIAGDLGGYLYFYTTCAALHADLGDHDAARTAYEKALSLGPSDAEEAYILGRISVLKK
jgi:RNA polymerase sigma-70 factor (ECF subfamily)